MKLGVKNQMSNWDIIEFLGLWKGLHNPDFKPVEFNGFRKEAGKMKLMDEMGIIVGKQVSKYGNYAFWYI